MADQETKLKRRRKRERAEWEFEKHGRVAIKERVPCSPIEIVTPYHETSEESAIPDGVYPLAD